jgi:hypothetical protein
MIARTKNIGDIEVTALSDGRLATSLDVENLLWSAPE